MTSRTRPPVLRSTAGPRPAIVLALAWFLQLAAMGPGAHAQEMDAPIDLQITTLLKVMEFDRSFHDRVGDEVVVGVLYQSRFRASANAVSDAQDYVEEQQLQEVLGIPLRFVFVDAGEIQGVENVIGREDLDFLYVAPLRAFDIRDITRVTRELGVPTLTGVGEFVQDGLSVGVTVQGQRLRILVNLQACRLEGMDLSSELLRLAEVVQ